MVDVVSNMLRVSDVFARLGGEEFAVLLPEISENQAVTIGNRIRTAIAKSPCKYNKETIPITVSIGCITHHKNNLETIDDILIAADQALYTAKNSGRNKLCQSD